MRAGTNRPLVKSPKINAARENANQKLFKDKSDGSRSRVLGI